MTVRILIGDVREKLAELPDESVHCCVTSPPYWGLRDYGTGSWDGGDPKCVHSVGGQVQDTKGAIVSGVRPGVDASRCRKCGAQRIDRQIGLEADFRDYIATMVEVFREVRRVLRHDGTLWLNLGDSYAGSWGAEGRRISESDDPSWHSSQIKNHPKRSASARGYRAGGLKPKDLMLMPARVAIALQEDGWWVRRDIIWSKPNPMPESCTDRCTSAHEYLFHLSKSANYYYDAAAIRETAGDDPGPGIAGWAVGDDHSAVGHNVGERTESHGTNYKRPNSPQSIKSPHGQGFTRRAGIGSKGNANTFRGGSYVGGEPGPRAEHGNVPNPTFSRNKRSVWTVATAPYSEAHFATFPPALIEPCILAGCPEGGTVCDPFGGAGTTGLVADRLGRNAILIELNPAYAEMARRRIHGDCPLLTEVA